MNTNKPAIEWSDKALYRVAKGTGITQRQLSRHIGSDRGMSVESIEILANYLGLEIIIPPKHFPKGR